MTPEQIEELKRQRANDLKPLAKIGDVSTMQTFARADIDFQNQKQDKMIGLMTATAVLGKGKDLAQNLKQKEIKSSLDFSLPEKVKENSTYIYTGVGVLLLLVVFFIVFKKSQ